MAVGVNVMSLAIEAFAENARRFCQWAESTTHDVTTARQLLLALMQGVPYLVIQAGWEKGSEYPQRGHDGWQADHKRFADFAFHYYREVFSPCGIDDEPPVTGDVHDDLADIYGELWHGLQALDSECFRRALLAPVLFSALGPPRCLGALRHRRVLQKNQQ